MFLALECVHDAPDSEPKLGRSLSLSLVPLTCSARGSNLFLCCVSAHVTGATGALLATLPFVAIIPHVVRGGPGLQMRDVWEPADHVLRELFLR